MPVFEIEDENGEIYEVDAPDERTAIGAFRRFQAGKNPDDGSANQYSRQLLAGIGEGVGSIPAMISDLAVMGYRAAPLNALWAPQSIYTYDPDDFEGAFDALTSNLPSSDPESILRDYSPEVLGGMEAVGMSPARDEPSSIGERAARGLGNVIPAMVGGGGVGAGLNAASKVPKLAKFLTSPKTMGAEATSGASAEVASGWAKDSGYGPMGQTLAGLVAGVGIPTVADIVGTVGKRSYKKVAEPFTKKGGRLRAQERIQDLITGPGSQDQKDAALQVARQGFDEPTTIPLSPAQRTGSPAIASLDETMAVTRPAQSARLEKTGRLQQDAVRQVVPSDTDVRRAQDELAADLNVQVDDLSQRIDAAPAQADTDIRAMADASVEDMGIQLSGERSAWINEQKRKSRDLWNRVPDNLLVQTDNFRDEVAALSPEQVNGLEDAWQFIVPGFAREAAERFDDVPANINPLTVPLQRKEEVRQMAALSSRLKYVARKAQTGAMDTVDRRIVPLANRLAAAIDQDIATVPEAARPYDNARAFTADYYKRMERKAPAKLERRRPSGEAEVPPELAAQETLGTGISPQRARAGRELEQTGVSQETIGQWFTSDFAKAGIKARDGTVDTGNLRKWMGDNRSVIETWPEIAPRLRQALRGKESADDLVQSLQQQINDIEAGPTAKFAQANVDDSWNTVLRSGRPEESAKALLRSAGDNQTMRRGIRGSALRSVLKSVQGRDGGIDADELVRVLAQPDNDAALALRGVLDPGEIPKLQRMAAELQKATQRNPQAVGELMGTPDNIPFLVKTPMQVFSAKLANYLGGGGDIQTPGIAVARTNNFLTRLYNVSTDKAILAALEDPDIMRVMLQPITNKNVDGLMGRMMGMMAGTVSARAIGAGTALGADGE